MGPVKGLALFVATGCRYSGKVDYSGGVLCRPPAGSTDVSLKGWFAREESHDVWSTSQGATQVTVVI